MIKVQLFTHEWPPHLHGGAGVHVVQLATALGAQPGVEVGVVPFVHLQAEEAALVQPLGAPDPALFNAVGATAYAARAIARAGAEHPDVVHAHTWFAVLAGRMAALASGAASVVTVHSVERARPWKQQSRGREYDLSTWIEDVGFAGADALIAVSQSVAADLRELHPELPPERIHVIYNGVDTSRWYRDVDPQVPRRLGIPDGQRYLVYVGRVSRQKGLVALLRAARQLPPDVALVVFAGEADPATLADARTAAGRLRDSGRVVIMVEGVYDIGVLRPVVSQAELMVVPSSYEPLGMVALEAFACGTPVVASAVGGLPEIVTPDRGWLCPVELDPGTLLPTDVDAFATQLAAVIDAALADDEGRARRGRAAAAAVTEEFDWRRIAAATVEVYRQVSRSS